MKISTKLVLTVFVLVTISMAFLGIVAISITQNRLTEQTVRQLESLAEVKEEQLVISIDRYLEWVSLIASRTQMRRLLSGYNVNPSEEDADSIKRILTDAKASIDGVEDIAVLGLDGKLVVSLVEELSENDLDLGGDINSNKLLGVQKDRQNRLQVKLAGPLNFENEKIGTIIVYARADLILSVVDDYSGLGETGEVLIAQRNMNDDALFLTPIRFDRDAALNRVESQQKTDLPMSLALKGIESIYDKNVVDYRGEEVLAVTRFIPSTGWGLVAKIDRSEALEPVRASTKTYSILTLTSLIVTSLIFYSYSRSISIPLKKLTMASNKVSEGEIEFGLPEELISRDDEFGIVTRAVERMAANLLAKNKEIASERSILESSIYSLPVGFALVDNNFKITVLNNALEQIFDQFKVHDFDGFAEVLKESSCDLVKLCNQSESKKETVVSSDVSLKESSVYLKVSVSTVNSLDEQKQKIGHILLVEDITESKALDRTKDEFFALASHELRTPLTTIRGNLEIIQESYKQVLKNKEVKSMIDDIYDSSLRLIKIVNDFLDVSRIEQGQIKLDKTEFDIVPLIKKIIRDMTPEAKAKKLKIKLNIKGKAKEVVVTDKERLEQVIINVVGNAIKYTETGEVNISLIREKEHLMVEVTDTGPGIEKKNAKYIFRKFMQGSDSVLTRDTSRGTGLGLYISKMIMKALGGDIYLAKSESGKSSTFVVKV